MIFIVHYRNDFFVRIFFLSPPLNVSLSSLFSCNGLASLSRLMFTACQLLSMAIEIDTKEIIGSQVDSNRFFSSSDFLL